MDLDIFNKVLNFIKKESEVILSLVDTAEDEISKGNEIKALIRVLIVLLLIAFMAAVAIFSIVIIFSKHGTFMKIVSAIIAFFFLIPIVILIVYTWKRFVGKDVEKRIKEDPEFNKERRQALKDMNKFIVQCLDELNKKANVGVQNQEDYNSLWDLIENYKKLKMEYEIYFDGELNEELSILLGELRRTRGEIGFKVS